jgi:uncharacterized protein (TIGR04255 family)
MKERQHYDHAPIVEALIDIQVKPLENITGERLTEFADMLKERFPEYRTIYETSAMIQTDLQNIKNVTVAHTPSIMRLENKQKHQVVQAKLSGFTFSLLFPYPQWEDLRDAARQEWEHYRAIMGPKLVTRIAVRYINRLDLPGDLREVLEYVRIFPSLPLNLPGGHVQSYGILIESPQDDLEAMLIINSGRVPPLPEKPDSFSLILDIDLFRDLSQKPWKLEDEKAVWEFLEQLHIRKNDVFESCITEKTRRIIR